MQAAPFAPGIRHCSSRGSCVKQTVFPPWPPIATPTPPLVNATLLDGYRDQVSVTLCHWRAQLLWVDLSKGRTIIWTWKADLLRDSFNIRKIQRSKKCFQLVSAFCDSGPVRLKQQRWTLRRLMESQPWIATRERPGVLLEALWKIFVSATLLHVLWRNLIAIFSQNRSTSCELEWTKQDLHI